MYHHSLHHETKKLAVLEMQPLLSHLIIVFSDVNDVLFLAQLGAKAIGWQCWSVCWSVHTDDIENPMTFSLAQP